MRTEDRYIIQQCLDGNAAAFGFLVNKYKDPVYALAYSQVHNFHDAQDIAQEVFIKAYRKLRDLRYWDNFMGWLCRITNNMCKDWLRARSRRPDGEFAEDQDPGILDRPSMDFYHENMVYESIHYALDSLPELYSQVLILRYFGGMTTREMSRFLAVSTSTIERRLREARTQMKEGMLAMMSGSYEQHQLPAIFTFRIVEAVKRIKINPMPRMAGLPWGLSAAVGIIITVLSLNPYLSIPGNISIPAGSPLPVETKVLKIGEIPVDILKTSGISIIASKQKHSDNESLDLQNALFMAPRAEASTWARKEGMPTARVGLSTSAVYGIIYAIGGSTDWDSMDLRTVEAYDPEKDIWTEKADMPTVRGGLSTSVVDGIIYAIGGWDENGSTLSTVEAYDPATDAWTTKADMPTARWGLSTSVMDGIIYAIGGRIGSGINGDSVPTVEVYDPVTDTWTEKADMPTRRGVHSASAVDGHIYVIGGWIDAATTLVEEYDPGSIAVGHASKQPTMWGEVKTK